LPAIDLVGGDDRMRPQPFQILARELSATAETAAGLLDSLIEAVSLPDIPPDVAEVRIMSLHKSKGLSSPVVIIAGCVEGLLPTAADADVSPAERQAELEEQRRLLFVGLTRVKAMPGENRPGVLVLTSSRSMSLADAMQSGIRPAGVRYGRAFVHTSRFIRELGPAAPAPQAG
jgi:DNA helicase II / ATP-dependent DNA helicase PcrA